MAGDTSSNITIDITGNTASIATDYANSGTGFSTAHVPISKIVWGESGSSSRTSLTNPLPIQISGQTGPIEITGYLSGTTYTNSISISNYAGTAGSSGDLEYIAVAGNTTGTQPVGISGSIQGITNGVPVIIATTGPSNGDYSTGIHIRGAMASDGASYGPTFGGTFGTALGILVQGTSAGATAYVGGETFPGYGFGVPIAVTAGRRLSKGTDTVTVTGDVGTSRSWNNLSSTDSISVYGSDQTPYVRTNLYYGTGGNSAGFSGDALKVAVVNGGITFSVSVSAETGVTNSGGALRVQGPVAEDGNAIVIKGENAGAVDVISNSGVSATVSGTVAIDDANLLQELKGTTGELLSRLTDIKTGTNQISAIRTDLKSGSVRTTISSIIRPDNIRAGSATSTTTATTIHNNMELKSGVTIKSSPTNNINIIIGNQTLQTNPSQGYLLEPGESIYLEISNLNKIYHIQDVTDQGASNQTLHYIGS